MPTIYIRSYLNSLFRLSSALLLTVPIVSHSHSHSNHKTETNQVSEFEIPLSFGQINTRKRFAKREQQALELGYSGVTTSSGKIHGLYKLEKTGVNNSGIVDSANGFLAALLPKQREKVSFDLDSEEWRKWSNVDNGIYARQGISLKQLTSPQQKSLFSLLESSLSHKGMEKVLSIVRSEHTLKELNNMAPHLDEQLYYISIMGTPSLTQPWGWQYEGHHLAINFFVLADQVVMSPVFMGAEPAVAVSGKYVGNTVLQQEQDDALKFIQSLSSAVQQQAVIETKQRTNMVAAANKDNLILDYQGVRAAKLCKHEKEQLLKLIALFVGNLNDENAQIKMEEVKKHLNDTYFAWAGGTNNDSAFYYRIHSPVILIEFDHQAPIGLPDIKERHKPIKDHIHVMVRTPNGNDYGKDLLGQHLQQHHAKGEER